MRGKGAMIVYILWGRGLVRYLKNGCYCVNRATKRLLRTKKYFQNVNLPAFTTPHHHTQTDIFNQFIESENEKNDIFLFLFNFIHTHEIKHDIQCNHGKTDLPFNLTHISKPNLQYYSTRVEKMDINRNP